MTRPSEYDHHYGEKIHWIRSAVLESELAKLCAPETIQPQVNFLVSEIYQGLLQFVVDQEFPSTPMTRTTRMHAHHPEVFLHGEFINPEVTAVCVNLARAGTLPSHVCYSALNSWLNPSRVRQDHISISRQSDAEHHVTGSAISGHKIGGSIEDAIVLIPDPMAATGSTLIETLNLYKKSGGKPRKIIAIHCIATPEYLKRVRDDAPEVIVYTLRVDRGLSPKEILKTVPGTFWEKEVGLNANGYIVPGGGGFGEVLNNAFI